MNGRYELKCSQCGAVLRIDELFMSQMGKELEEETNKKIQEAVEFQRKQISEEEDKKAQTAVELARKEQQDRIDELLKQIELLTDANTKAVEKMGEMQKQIFDMQQKAKTAELEAQEKLNEKAGELYEKARKESDEAYALKIAALEKKVVDANNATEEVRKKLVQGSQQLQGEIQELKLEECLRAEFPFDTVEEVEKGKNGADVIQTVVNRNGKVCGRIVWESKNVKNWQSGFIPKLREDMARVNGDIGILVSHVFGKDMGEFCFEQGVWLVKPGNALSMARLVRDRILAVSEAKIMADNKEELEDAVFAYVTSPAFRNRMENIGRQYRALDEEINKTKDAMVRHWETQRKLIDELVGNTQGILGEVNAFLLQADSKDLPPPEDFDEE